MARLRKGLNDLGPLGQFAASGLPQDEIERRKAAEQPLARLPGSVVADLEAGKPGFTPEEFQGVLGALQQGQLDNPQAVKNLFVGLVPRAGLDALNGAIAAHEAERDILNAPPSPIAQVVPGGKPGLILGKQAIDAATLGLAGQAPRLTGRAEIDRLLQAQGKGQAAVEKQVRERFPVASTAAELAGTVVPYVGAAKLLRGFRAARGLPEVAPGAEGAVAEGAKLGGVLESLRTPEGGEDMTPGQAVQARALQAAVGVATGALLDFGLMGLGEWQGVVRGALADRAKRVELTAEAQRAGFDSPEEYLSTLTEIQRTPDGLVIRPNREVINDLPGSAASVGDTRQEPNLEKGASAVRVGDAGQDGNRGALHPPGEAGTQISGDAGGVPVELSEGVQAGNPGNEGRSPRAFLAQAGEFERLGQTTEDPAVRSHLLQMALDLRKQADAVQAGQAPKLNPQERARQNRIVQPQTDDLITAVRKLGGIDVDYESDWAGRLSHLPRTGFGLPAIEQYTGKGRTLDDLAEALADLGYLSGRDVRELEDKLDQASMGAEVWSAFKNDFEAGRARPPRERAEPVAREPVERAGSDPFGMGGRPVGDAFWREPGADESPAPERVAQLEQALNGLKEGAGTDMVERLSMADLPDPEIIRALEDGIAAQRAAMVKGAGPEVPGRDVQPLPEGETHGRQEGQEGRRQEEVLAGGPESSLSEVDSGRIHRAQAALSAMYDARLAVIRSPGGGRSDPWKQAQSYIDKPLTIDLSHVETTLPIEKPGVHPGRAEFEEAYFRRVPDEDGYQPIGLNVAHIPIGEIRIGLSRIESPADAAHVIAGIRKGAQEHLVAVVTDGDGKLLRVFHAAQGVQEAAISRPAQLAGFAANTPGARQVWLGHNHPSGMPRQSEADHALTDQVADLLHGSGVNFEGMLVATPGGKAMSLYRPGQGESMTRVTVRPRRDAIPLSVRTLRGVREFPSIPTMEMVKESIPDFPRESGLIFLDYADTPTGFLPLSLADMQRLRQGDGGPSRRLLAALDKSNASGFFVKLGPGESVESREAKRAARNLYTFGRQAKVAFLDMIDAEGTFRQEVVSTRLRKQATFYANPFLLGFGDVVKDIGLAPKRSALEAAGGAALGAVSSDDEPGSAGWWLDVAKGAAAGKLAFTGARRLGLAGPGSHFERLVFGKLGGWIEGLPLIGRGPDDLRALKRKQGLMRQLLDRQTAEVGKFLRENFTPAERGMMADLIETRGIVPDLNLIHRQAQQLDEFITDAGERMKALGMLPADLATGGYLHRYYAKQLEQGALLKVSKAWKQSLSGAYTLARGTEDHFGRNYFSPGAQEVLREFEAVQAQIAALEKQARGSVISPRTPGRNPEKEIQALQEKIADLEAERRGADASGPAAAFLSAKIDDLRAQIETLRAEPATPGRKAKRGEAPDLFGDLADLRARRKALQQVELIEYLGEERGRMQSYLFRRDEVPRADAGVQPVKGAEFRPGAAEKQVGPGMEFVPLARLAPTERVWSLRGLDERRALLHRDWTEAERRAWGEIKDAGYRYVRHMAEVSHDISLATLFNAVAKRADWVSSEAREGWVEVPGGAVGKDSPLRKYGALAGKWVRPDVWAGLRGHGRSPLGSSPVAKIYRAAVDRWKLWHTADNPVTHFNNLFSNSEMLFLAGYSPADLAKALNHMRQGEASALWQEAREQGLFGTDWAASILAGDGGEAATLADLAEQLRTQPDIPDAAQVTSWLMDAKRAFMESRAAIQGAEGPWKTGAEVIKAMNRPAIAGLKLVAKPYAVYARLMRRAYGFEDNLFKLAVYQAERAKGATADAATNAASRFFFDYHDVPEAVRWVRDLPIGAPFISYTYLAIPAIARNVIERPERVFALVAGYEALNYAAMQATADGQAPNDYWALHRAEDELSSPWDRGRSALGMLDSIHLPFPEGYRLALGRSHVFGNPFASEAGGREKLPSMPVIGDMWGSSIFGGSPLHALLDVAINEDWKGKPIFHEKDPADIKAKKASAYLWQSFGPSTPVFPGSYSQSKILEGLANDVRRARAAGENHLAAPLVAGANAIAEALGGSQLTGLDRAENEILTRDALLGAMGIKLRPARFDQVQEFELGKIQAERKKVGDRLKREQRAGAEGRKTDAQVEEAWAAWERDMKALDEQEETLYRAAEVLQQMQGIGRK